MSINGEYLTMAQACGEAEVGSPAYVAGIDFDPDDDEEVEAVRLATERDRFDRIEQLERDNANLRATLARLDERGLLYQADAADLHDDRAYVEAVDDELARRAALDNDEPEYWG